MELDGERAVVRPLLTDLYQATMALGYWRAGQACEAAEFELFFRQCPFGGSFALAAGLRDCMCFLRSFRLQDAGSSATRAGTPSSGWERIPLPPPRPLNVTLTSEGTYLHLAGQVLPQTTCILSRPRRAVPGFSATPRHRPWVLRAPSGP